MFVDSGRLHIAVQKDGRLSGPSRELLRDAGLKIQNGKSSLTARVENFPIDLMFVRDDDIPVFVSDGVCEYGIVGENLLQEFMLGHDEQPLDIVAKLGFGRCTLKIAGPERLAYEGAQSLQGQRIATSYPNLLGSFLEARDIGAEVIEMRGAVELAPRLGIAGFICDLVSTGATLEANGLTPHETVLESEAVLVRSRKSPGPAKEELGSNLMARIEGVLATNESKYIMMNAPEEALSKISAILPGADAPTLLPLAGRPGHYAVHALCKESVFWETLEQLKGAGASAILVLDIEKMMM
jgi:ATP phosphoribosyltransferase